MPISIKNRATEAITRRLAELSGESITNAIHEAVAEKVERLERRRKAPLRRERLLAIAEQCASRPIISDISEDEILGYDKSGVPTQ